MGHPSTCVRAATCQMLKALTLTITLVLLFELRIESPTTLEMGRFSGTVASTRSAGRLLHRGPISCVSHEIPSRSRKKKPQKKKKKKEDYI